MTSGCRGLGAIRTGNCCPITGRFSSASHATPRSGSARSRRRSGSRNAPCSGSWPSCVRMGWSARPAKGAAIATGSTVPAPCRGSRPRRARCWTRSTARSSLRKSLAVEINERQRFLLEKVIEAHVALGQPVGSKWLSEQPDVPWGPSTVRAELARLEEVGLLRHPHTSAGRAPTDRGYREYVDQMLAHGKLPVPAPKPVQLEVSRREVDQAMQTATEQLSQVTNLLAIVTAPPIATSTIKHIELLALQPQLAMIVVITSTGGVTKRLISSDRPLDRGLIDWARSYLNEELGGMSVGARMINAKLSDPSLSHGERAFLQTLLPTFTELEERSGDTLYVDGAARLMSEDRVPELSQLSDLMLMLEHRVAFLSILQDALDEPRVFLRIGQENERAELKSLSIVASGYGHASRSLGAVSVIGPVRMDYGHAITSVRAAAAELSRFVGELYE